MPKTLNGYQFPIGYGPWYVYEVDLSDTVANISGINKYDFLTPASGKFQLAATGAVVITGFAIALEKYAVGIKTMQVAMPGSLVLAVAGGALQPGSLVKISVPTDGDQSNSTVVVAAAAADLAAGRVVGRYRAKYSDSKKQGAAAKDDIILVETGVV